LSHFLVYICHAVLLKGLRRYRILYSCLSMFMYLHVFLLFICQYDLIFNFIYWLESIKKKIKDGELWSSYVKTWCVGGRQPRSEYSFVPMLFQFPLNFFKYYLWDILYLWIDAVCILVLIGIGKAETDTILKILFSFSWLKLYTQCYRLQWKKTPYIWSFD
jgi:hypothetical protein